MPTPQQLEDARSIYPRSRQASRFLTKAQFAFQNTTLRYFCIQRDVRTCKDNPALIRPKYKYQGSIRARLLNQKLRKPVINERHIKANEMRNADETRNEKLRKKGKDPVVSVKPVQPEWPFAQKWPIDFWVSVVKFLVSGETDRSDRPEDRLSFEDKQELLEIIKRRFANAKMYPTEIADKPHTVTCEKVWTALKLCVYPTDHRDLAQKLLDCQERWKCHRKAGMFEGTPQQRAVAAVTELALRAELWLAAYQGKRQKLI